MKFYSNQVQSCTYLDYYKGVQLTLYVADMIGTRIFTAFQCYLCHWTKQKFKILRTTHNKPNSYETLPNLKKQG